MDRGMGDCKGKWEGGGGEGGVEEKGYLGHKHLPTLCNPCALYTEQADIIVFID